MGGDLPCLLMHSNPLLIFQRSTQHKAGNMILRIRQSGIFHFTVHTVNALAEFFHIFIDMQKFDNLGVAGKMHFAHIVGANQSGELAWTFYGHVVIEHLDLDLGADNVVVAVSDGIDNQLSPAELREFGDGDEQVIFAEKRVLTNLALYKLCGFLHFCGQKAAFLCESAVLLCYSYQSCHHFLLSIYFLLMGDCYSPCPLS